MPISFPASPTTGQTYTYLNKTWTYNGTTWDANTTASIASAVAPITYNATTQAVGINQSGITIAESQVTNLVTDLAAKAPKINPVFTGDGVGNIAEFKKSNGVTRTWVNSNGSEIYVGGNSNESGSVQIGHGATGNQYAYVDLIGDTTYTDYGARLIRGNGGANADTVLAHRGAGPLVIKTEDTGPLKLATAGVDRVVIDQNGWTSFGNTIQTKANTGGAYLNSNDVGGLSVRGSIGNAASMSFHIPGQYAINMGLDTDNGFKIGGWSTGADRLVIQQAGQVRTPSQPAIVLDGNYSAWETNTANTTVKRMVDRGSSRGGFVWNATNGRLTVPVTGWYAMSYITYQAANTVQRLHLRKNDGSFAMRHFYQSGGDGQCMIYGMVYANANDYFDVYLEYATNSYYGPNHSFATVHFLG